MPDDDDGDDFPGFPVGETKEEFEAAVDRLLKWRERQEPKPKRLGKSTHVLACQRVKVAQCPARLPAKYTENLEQNQLIESYCRHPENHDIEAWFSCTEEQQKGTPDIYKFYCGTCGRTHVRFCVGGGDSRPFWEVR